MDLLKSCLVLFRGRLLFREIVASLLPPPPLPPLFGGFVKLFIFTLLVKSFLFSFMALGFKGC